MRIIFHKMKKDAVLDAFFVDAFSEIRKSYPLFDGTTWEKDSPCRSIAYVCPHCGCEIYGEWTVTSVSKGKYNRNQALKQGIGNQPEVFDSAVSYINSHAQAKQLAAFAPSVHQMCGLKACPLCGGSLAHKPGYSLVYSTIDGGSPLDEMLDDHFCCEMVPEPLFSEDDVHFDWDSLYECGCNSYNGDYDPEKWSFAVLKIVRKRYEEIQAEADHLRFCESCDVSAENPVPAEQVEQIKATPAKLKDYLQNLIKTEMNIYSVSEHLKSLYTVRPETNRKARMKKHEPLVALTEQIKETQGQIEEAEKACKLAESYVEKMKASAPAPIGLVPPQKPEAPQLEIPGLFNKKKVLAENAARQNQFQLDLISYQEDYQRYLEKKTKLEEQSAQQHQQEIDNAAQGEILAKKALADKQQELLSYQEKLADLQAAPAADSAQLSFKNMIDKEITDGEEMLKQLYTCRNKLYAMDIVFSKYRNVVAISTFYEYLMAGRCMVLEGPDGAYNLYETQIRADMIIGQLSLVLQKLDEIKDSQYLIYSEIQSVNKSLDRMNETMNLAMKSLQSMDKKIQHISENSDIIAHNTAVTAHYAKVNAELTNALGYMVAFC